MRSHSPACSERSLFGGIIFIVIGAAFLVANLGWSLPVLLRIWWPVIPIVIGALNVFAFAWRGRRGGRPYTDFA